MHVSAKKIKSLLDEESIIQNWKIHWENTFPLMIQLQMMNDNSVGGRFRFGDLFVNGIANARIA